MDRVEILNGLLAESFDLNKYGQEPSSGEIVEIRMEDIQSDDDLSEESDEPEEEEIECPIGQYQSNTSIKMETDSDCEVIATWEENDTTDRKVASSQIVPETRSQDDLMLSYHNSYSSNYPININQVDTAPTTVLEDKIKKATAENPSGGVLFSLLHTNVPVNLRNQGNTQTCKNNDVETVTVQIKEKPSNETEENKTSDSIQETDKEKSLLFLLLTNRQEEIKYMKNHLKEKKNYKTCVTGGHMVNSSSSQKDQEKQEHQNTMDPISMYRKQNVNSFHKSKKKQRKNVFKPPLEVFKPIGTNNSKQRDVFEKKVTINRPQRVDTTPRNFGLRNRTKKNVSNNSPILFRPTEIASTSSENLKVFKPIGTNTSKQRDIFEKKQTIDRVTQIPGNFALGNSMQQNESNNCPTLFHPTEKAGTSSENLEVFKPIGTNTSKQRDVFEKKLNIDRVTQGVVDVTQIPGNFALGNSTQKNESNNCSPLFHSTEMAATSSENLEVLEPIGTNTSKQRDVFEKKRTIDGVTQGAVDVTQIPGNFASGNSIQKNESNNLPPLFSPTRVAAKSWENLAKLFQDGEIMKNKREIKNKTAIHRKYTPKRNQPPIDQESQENQKNTVSVGIHCKQNEKNFHNSKRKPEEVFETVGLDNSKQIDVSEKGKHNQQMQKVIVREHFVLRNSMQKNDSSNLLENTVATPWVNLTKTPQTDERNTVINGSTQVEFGLNHNGCKENTYNMVRKETNLPGSSILNDKTSMLYSLLNNGKGNSSNQLEIVQENQQKVNPVLIHNTQNDVHFHNTKRKQENTQLGMFEYISMDSDKSNQRDLSEKEVEKYALKNDFHHNEMTNLNKDVDPLENLKSELSQNNQNTTINIHNQGDQTDNMLKNNTKQNQNSSNDSSMLFSLLINGRGNRNQPCQETQRNQRNMDPGMICDQQNEVISNNRVRKRGGLKILGNVCIAEAHRNASERGRITNKETEGKGGSVKQAEESVVSINAVDTAREYLDKTFSNPRRNVNKQVLLGSTTKNFIESTNMLAHQLSDRPASALNEAKLAEPIIHDSISQRLLGQNNEKTTIENGRKNATNSKKTQRQEIHQKRTPQQSLINASRQQMNLNINRENEVLVRDNVKDNHENIAAPKKIDILQREQTNYAPVAIEKHNVNVGEVNRINNIQGNLVPVMTNKGLRYCVVIPKHKKPSQEKKKDGLNPWLEQINYRRRKRNVEQCDLVGSSSEDESNDDPREHNKKRKLAKNSSTVVKNVNFTRCNISERNNLLEKVRHKGKQSIEANMITETEKALLPPLEYGKHNYQECRTAQAQDNKELDIDKQNVHHSGKQENELRVQNGDSVSKDNIYEDPFDCSSSSDGDILEDPSDVEFTNEDQESGVKEVPKSTDFTNFNKVGYGHS